VKRSLPPNFHLVAVRGIGVFIPPTEFFHLCERWPQLFLRLSKVENTVAAWWPFSRMSDHFLIVLRKGLVSN